MKELWVSVIPFDRDLAATAIEAGADVLVVEHSAPVLELSRVRTAAPDGDVVPGRDVFEVTIRGSSDEDEAVALSGNAYVIVRTTDWSVIPLENLVSRSARIIAAVRDVHEAEVALHVLERGVHGLLIEKPTRDLIRTVASMVKESEGTAALVPFTVTSVRPAGMGDRVCVDSTSLLADGEGMLVGNTSEALLLVHAETLENPYVAPRPFRVNAGAVHVYILTPEGKTAYLSDLKSGDRVLAADRNGAIREVTVGRVKCERRPMLLVEAVYEGTTASLVLQNAETIRLVRESGEAVSVVGIAPGDRVLGVVMEGGRHFGVAVRETITEK